MASMSQEVAQQIRETAVFISGYYAGAGMGHANEPTDWEKRIRAAIFQYNNSPELSKIIFGFRNSAILAADEMKRNNKVDSGWMDKQIKQYLDEFVKNNRVRLS